MKKLLWALMLVPLLSAFCFCGCDDYEYDDEYWKSVQREKVMRKSGFDDLADHEAKTRQDRLRFQKKPKSQGVTPTGYAVTTVGVVIIIGFIVMTIHLSTKNANKETDEHQDTLPQSVETKDKKETIEDNDIIGKLERLANLKDRGAITDNEFENEKRKLLK